MSHFTKIAFSDAVKKKQHDYASRDAMARLEKNGDPRDEITPELAAFIRTRVSFYLASASLDGQPYIQHRGGAAGFLRVLNPHCLSYSEYTGNRQYISEGNLSENPRAMLFLMDYENARRIKIWGEARISSDPELLRDTPFAPGISATQGRRQLTGRSILFHVLAWDANCPRFIPKLTANSARDERERCGHLQHRIDDLKMQLAQALGKQPPKAHETG